MSAAKTCWGVYREMAHSPGRIDDDSAIMKRVGEVMTERGFSVGMVDNPGSALVKALEVLDLDPSGGKP